MIIVDNYGSPLFLQERIGQNGIVFSIIKFRTMIVNAENIGDKLSVKSSDDFRITRIGKILRKLSIDELPQLLNVLIGDMSLVGPRPPATYHPYLGYDNYPEKYKRRFEAKPGITGLAQVKYRNSKTWQERFEIDLQYLENYSLLLDFRIIAYTFLAVLRSRNIYS